MKSSVSNSIIPPKAKEGLHFCPAVVLPLLFFLSVGVRFTLAYFFRHGPSVTIDESLYINIYIFGWNCDTRQPGAFIERISAD